MIKDLYDKGLCDLFISCVLGQLKIAKNSLNNLMTSNIASSHQSFIIYCIIIQYVLHSLSNYCVQMHPEALIREDCN